MASPSLPGTWTTTGTQALKSRTRLLLDHILAVRQSSTLSCGKLRRRFRAGGHPPPNLCHRVQIFPLQKRHPAAEHDPVEEEEVHGPFVREVEGEEHEEREAAGLRNPDEERDGELDVE